MRKFVLRKSTSKQYRPKNSIRFRFAAIIVLLMSSAFICLWLINDNFLGKFYYQNKIDQMIKSYGIIQYCANTESLTEEEIDNYMLQIREKYNLAIIYADEGWNATLYASKKEGEYLLYQLQALVMTKDLSKLKIVYDDSAIVIAEMEGIGSQTLYLYAWGKAGNDSMFIMRTPLESISESTQIANRFLLYTGSIVIFLVVCVVWFFTKTMTRPILKLAELSEHMANLDFKERYKDNTYNEIDILGHSMNTMAEHLEEIIQELKVANEQLKREIDEKVQIDEMRKEFLSNVSHELKTPIALIQGYAEGLQEVVNDDPDSREYYCEVIIDETAKMNVMVRKLLTLNHLEFGQDVLDIEEFNLSDLIHSVVQANDIMIQQKGAQVSVHIPNVCVVKGDEFKIEEVLINYLSNALNHLDYERQIEIKAEELLQEDGVRKVRIYVFNTGNCIPEEDLEKVWIKFYKVDKARTREYGGSGIGLSIVKAIMDSHHQPFGVSNRENGVEFWFELEKINVEIL